MLLLQRSRGKRGNQKMTRHPLRLKKHSPQGFSSLRPAPLSAPENKRVGGYGWVPWPRLAVLTALALAVLFVPLSLAAGSPPNIEVNPGPAGELRVTWTCQAGVEQYSLAWKLSEDEMYSASNKFRIGCTAGTKNTFIIDGLLPGTDYDVRMTANVEGLPYSEKTMVRTGRARTFGGGGGGAPSPPPPPPPVAPPPSDTEPSPDRAPLLALYQAAGGESWENKWYTDFPVDDWHGVRTNEDGRVTELDLSSNGLGGEIEEITEEIGKLGYLETLDLSGNPELGGELPSDLMELENLEALDIQNTGLCAPLDEAFQDWLMGITFHGENCAEDEPEVSGGGGCSVSSDGGTGDGAISALLGLLLVAFVLSDVLRKTASRPEKLSPSAGRAFLPRKP